VRTTSGQESHQLHSMSEANSLALLPDGAGVQAGEQVTVLLIDPDRLSADTSLVLQAPTGPLEAS
jgi:molybdopterin biosynthesis enzyme